MRDYPGFCFVIIAEGHYRPTLSGNTSRWRDFKFYSPADSEIVFSSDVVIIIESSVDGIRVILVMLITKYTSLLVQSSKKTAMVSPTYYNRNNNNGGPASGSPLLSEEEEETCCDIAAR